MPWPFRRRRGAPSPRNAGTSASERPLGGWRELPALAPVIPPQPTSGSRQFVRTLPSRWQQPPALGPLGHDVRADAAGGTVSGLAVLASRPGTAGEAGAGLAGHGTATAAPIVSGPG